MNTLNSLSVKQLNFISKHGITVTKLDSSDPSVDEYVYFIEGVYNQQKSKSSEVGAYLAAIEKVIGKKK